MEADCTTVDDLDYNHQNVSSDYKYSESIELISQGAEARVYKGLFLGRIAIVKERFSKQYRHPELDEKLTKDRMKAEVRCMERCRSHGLHVPTIFFIDRFRNRIIMEFVENAVSLRQFIWEKYRQILQENNPDSDLKEQLRGTLRPHALCLGKSLALMHQNNVIHGDLTTSNILVRSQVSSACGDGIPDLVFIDFGLSYSNSLAEDKAVDLYVLERALLSTHPNSDLFFDDILASYQQNFVKGGAGVKRKLDEVRLRGRKRMMVG